MMNDDRSHYADKVKDDSQVSHVSVRDWGFATQVMTCVTTVWCSLKEGQRGCSICGSVVFVYFLVLALALPLGFPESPFSFVCLPTLTFFCCRKDEVIFYNQWTAKRSQCSSWFDCSYFNHSVSLEVLPILLRLMRLVVHVLASSFRLSTTTVLLHHKQRVWRQMNFFIVSPRECCLHLER